MTIEIKQRRKEMKKYNSQDDSSRKNEQINSKKLTYLIHPDKEINKLAENLISNIHNNSKETIFKNKQEADIGINISKSWIKRAFQQGSSQREKEILEMFENNRIISSKKESSIK